MNTTLISHASVLIKTKDCSILSDPWFEGTVFNDSWALVAEAEKVDFSTIDYIYISHEHPDHFNFPTLKKIPSDVKKNISILYQNHTSKRLKNALLKMGFKEVIELPLYNWIKIKDTSFYCGSVGSMDSFLAVKDDEHTILNLNDCVLNKKHYEYIKKEIGNIDVLYTQFSFANWIGNNSDFYNEAERKTKDIKTQVEVLQPEHTIPFASFVYFCNHENFWMNSFVNFPTKVSQAQIHTVKFVKIGEEIDLHQPHFDNESAVRFWQEKYANITTTVFPKSAELSDIETSCIAMFEKFKRIPFYRFILNDLNVYLTDLNKSISISFGRKSIKISDGQSSLNRYTMCSQAFKYMVDFTWGGNTLQISGMYKDLEIGKRHHNFFFWQNLLNTEFINFDTFATFWTSMKFLYAKRLEILYKYI